MGPQSTLVQTVDEVENLKSKNVVVAYFGEDNEDY